MPNVTLTDDQVVELIQQLPPDRKERVLFLLTTKAEANANAHFNCAEARMRQLVAKRGQDWDALPESQREELIDDLVHEHRQCPR